MILRLLILPILLLLLSSCGKKEEEKPVSPTTSTPALPASVQAKEELSVRKYTIQDIDNRRSTLEFYPDHVVFRKIRQPIVLLYIFSDRCAPCRGMLPYMGDLQKKNARDLFEIGILVHSDTNRTAVRNMMHRYEAPFFISIHPDNESLAESLAREHNLSDNYPLPLTLIYKHGKYVMHIAGAAPYEMLQSLIDQLKEKKE